MNERSSWYRRVAIAIAAMRRLLDRSASRLPHDLDPMSDVALNLDAASEHLRRAEEHISAVAKGLDSDEG